jgi:hypothetical protein
MYMSGTKAKACTSISCVPTDFIRIEKRDRSTLGRRVASARRIATDMIPSKTANPFSTCFLKMHRQKNSAKNHHLFRNLNQIERVLSRESL